LLLFLTCKFFFFKYRDMYRIVRSVSWYESNREASVSLQPWYIINLPNKLLDTNLGPISIKHVFPLFCSKALFLLTSFSWNGVLSIQMSLEYVSKSTSENNRAQHQLTFPSVHLTSSHKMLLEIPFWCKNWAITLVLNWNIITKW
jgi:hypothetical protein